ncbi:MAG: hypothetical protein ACRDSE_20860 [Pseudonocardiaceae bacterium]
MELVDTVAAGRNVTAGEAPSAARPAMARALHSVPARRDPHQTQPESVRQVETGHSVWRIQCGDMIHRDRCVTVFADAGEVVVVGPPGETARLSAVQVNQLRTALNEATELAEGSR